MAGSPLRLAAVVTLDTSKVPAAVQSTKQSFGEIGTAAQTSAAQVQKLVDAQLRIAQPTINTSSRAADIAAYGQALDRLTAKYEPLYAAQKKLEAAIADINQAQSVGAISSSRAIELRLQETNSYNALASSIAGAAAARKAFAQAAVDRVTATPDRGADIAAYGAKLDSLQASVDRLFAAQQKYKSAIEQINEAQRTGAISASQAIDFRLREKSAYDALTSSINNAAIARKAFAQSAVDRVTTTPNREADIAAYGQQLDQLRAEFNPRYAVISGYQSDVARLREAQSVGAISPEEMTTELQRRRRAALGSIDQIKGRSPDSGPAAQFRRQNLTYQAFDVGQGIAGGMPLSMVAVQQGPQILQLYASQGGVNAALRDFSSLAAGVGRFITPVTSTIGGLTAALAVGAKAWGDYLASTKEVETAAAGLGRAVAGTQASMEASASAGASAAGISVTSARSMEAGFLRTGKIGSENFEKLIAISKDFAVTIGTDTDAAGQALAEMFSDPEKAAQALYQQYGLIDAATARQATNLARSNRQTEAQAVLLDALPGKLAKASESTTALGRAWDGVATAASNAWDWMGRATNKALSEPSLEDQRAMAQVRLSNVQGGGVSGWLGSLFGGDKAAQANVDNLDAQINKRDADAAERQKQANDIRLSVAATSLSSASPANADALRIESLRNNIAAMNAGKDATNDLTLRQQITTAIDAQSRVMDALINKQARAIELDRLDIQIQNERNPITRADLEARRTRLQLSDQEINSRDLENQAANARNKIILETISTAQTQTSDMRTEIGIRSSLTAQVAAGTLTADQANTQLQTELALRPLILAAATAEAGKRQELLDTVTKLRVAYDATAEAQRNANAASYVSDQQRNIDRMRFQTSIAGRGTNDQSMLLAQYDAEVKIRELGASTDLAAKIRANATETEKWNQQLARTTDAWNTIRRAEEDAIDSAVDKLSSGDFKGALDSIADDAKKTLLQVGVANPLKNALTGSNYGTFGDVGGVSGVFKQMFGGDKSVASMAVTAGTVMINGGVTGGAGALLPQAANNNALGLVSSNPLGAVGSALSFGGNYKGTNVDPRLTDILNTTALRMPGYSAQAISGYRAGDPRFHGQGLATDIQLTDLASGKQLGNYQDAGSFGTYERFAQMARQVQMQKYPELADQFRWGGYFSGGKGTYGAMDAMHFDLGGNKVGMGGGSWANGLNSSQASLWPGIQSSGNQAAQALTKLAAGSQGATQNLGVFGNGLGQFGQNLGSAFNGAGATAGGGGLFGSLTSGTSNFFTSLFGGSVSDPSSAFWRPNTTYSSFLTKGFDGGGYTGYGGRLEPAGVAHKGEVIWNQDDVRRVGGPAVAEAIRLGYRGYDRGGVVSGGQTVVNASNGGREGKIEIHNYSNANVQAEQTTDEKGARQTKFVISDTVGDALNAKGGGAAKTLNRTFGVKRRGIAR
ncbi:phage tail length tape measure family protein [Rhizobium lusitanum]|uniref:Phage-related minor tail protein n=1 Tax=Rhizobium lusitanum TaxID=293958 RepID=A0A1C3USY2_9HYPH|nr:phage tail length tape measure family protein [Rhizobium lusitanum]SCB18534.1 Phage-related minor tail protein [Rhizobium lusitanum]